ncbi:type I toxin-antitoxin system Fst family toxin [Lactococcus petauri]
MALPNTRLKLSGGDLMLSALFTAVVAPLFVGVALELFSRWLDKKE